MRLLAIWGVLGALAGAVHADPVDSGVWTGTRISTGATTPPGTPFQTTEENSFSTGTANSDSNAFDDDGQPLDTDRDFFATAEGSLVSGTVGFLTEGAGGPAGLAGNSSVSARAVLIETLAFGNGGVVPFSATVDGELESDLPMQFAFNELRVIIAPGDIGFTQNTLTDFDSLVDFFVALDDVEIVDVIGGFPLVQGFNENSINGSFVAAPNTSYKLILYSSLITLNNDASNQWTADFLSTASFDFDLTGFQVTSASGAFPGTGPAPVPEPAFVALGLVGCAVAWRRRRRA